jgi:hypothetical protein
MKPAMESTRHPTRWPSPVQDEEDEELLDEEDLEERKRGRERDRQRRQERIAAFDRRAPRR